MIFVKKCFSIILTAAVENLRSRNNRTIVKYSKIVSGQNLVFCALKSNLKNYSVFRKSRYLTTYLFSFFCTLFMKTLSWKIDTYSNFFRYFLFCFVSKEYLPIRLVFSCSSYLNETTTTTFPNVW